MAGYGPSRPAGRACNVGLWCKPTFECRYQHPVASKSNPKQSHKGRAYNEAFSKWLSTNTLVVHNNERLHLNHPNGVWRKWQESRKGGKATPATKRAKTKHEDEIARLKAYNDRLRSEGGNLFTGKSSVDDILKVLIDTVNSRKFAELIKRGFELAIEYDYLSKEAPEQAKEDARAKLKDKLSHRD
jgi:hypothetical protein